MNSVLLPDKEQYVEWFSEEPFKFWVTLTFRNSVVSIQHVEHCLKNLNRTLRRKVFGKHALKLDKFNKSELISMAAMIEECADGKFHVHALLTSPPKSLKPKEFSMAKNIIDEWQMITGSSNNKIDPLLAKGDIKQKTGYMLKTFKQYPERLSLYCWDA